MSGLPDYLRKRLLQTGVLEKADLIFALAGHRNRKIYAARLFREGWARQVLMSTGDPPYIARVLGAELAPNSLPEQLVVQLREVGASASPRKGHFFAYLDQQHWSVEPISAGWFGTLREMKALADWLKRHPPTQSLLIVSSALHLKRVGMCCRRILSRDYRVRLVAVPADEVNLSMSGKMPENQGTRRILLEWAKVLLYYLVLPLQNRGTGS